MKLADAPAEVVAELTNRRIRFGSTTPPPDGELWFDAKWTCSVCGRCDDITTCIDHCHVTGLERGRLCRGCNAAEGRTKGGALWPFWRRNAPLLANRTIHPRDPYNDPRPVYPAEIALIADVGLMLDTYETARLVVETQTAGAA